MKLEVTKICGVIGLVMLNGFSPWTTKFANAGLSDYPKKTIVMVVPFPPGGSADIVARVIGKPLSDAFGQPVVVENKPGADGAIAAEAVAKARPDGYTLFMATYGAMSVVPALHKNIGYDVVSDFTPISEAGKFAFFLFAHPSLPSKTVSEFIRYAKSHPGQVNYGTGNAGSIVAMAELATIAKLDLVHVPYKGEVPAMADFVPGRIQVMFATPANALSWVKEGKLRALAYVSQKRSPLLPEVPTLIESGIRDLTISSWAGIFGPSKMPAAITEAVSKTINSILLRDDVLAEFSKQGFEGGGSTPEQLGIYVKAQLQVWRDAVKTAGIVPD